FGQFVGKYCPPAPLRAGIELALFLTRLGKGESNQEKSIQATALFDRASARICDKTTCCFHPALYLA
ncbi:hypothetical protein, partial [Pseudomonas sp. H26/SER47-MNA-CIBAN-0231]|uniref:hypothetical protein n=1 Tax=Pseudomonas sp. H26/SER47-MNA-CIBAN-0231 TaxID=3140477 RepID=UPI003325F244